MSNLRDDSPSINQQVPSFGSDISIQGKVGEQVVYNTLTGRKEKFEPAQPPLVRMYSCGPTVYDLLHVGNFRGAIFYNLVRNWLEELGYQVEFVYNYTDVDDKIIQRAEKDKLSSQEVAEKYTNEFEADFARLGLRPHSLNPKVTENIPAILAMIEELVAKKFAYVASSGDVLFSIRDFSNYGKLSHRNPDELMAGVRKDVGSGKKDPLDFVLWKKSKPGEPAWPSSWGAGRPGWHIECSAMVRAHLGDHIDIHGGGLDLVFPHHENEIAQSEACLGHSFVRYWMHNNLINFGGTKMSKSLGNVRTARSFMDEFHPEILKYMMLASHYRSVLDFSPPAIENSIHALARVYSALALARFCVREGERLGLAVSDSDRQKEHARLSASLEKIAVSLCDDFNTPELLAEIFAAVRSFNSNYRRGGKISSVHLAQAQGLLSLVIRVGSWMALFQRPAEEFLRELDDLLLRKKGLERGKVDDLVAKRNQARAEKNFSLSDQLRDQLVQMGISLSDTPQGSHWEVSK